MKNIVRMLGEETGFGSAVNPTIFVTDGTDKRDVKGVKSHEKRRDVDLK